MKVSLKAMRVNAEMSQFEAAKALGVTKNTIFNWETYKTSPNANQLIRLCEIYGCTMDDIFLPVVLAESES